MSTSSIAVAPRRGGPFITGTPIVNTDCPDKVRPIRTASNFITAGAARRTRFPISGRRMQVQKVLLLPRFCARPRRMSSRSLGGRFRYPSFSLHERIGGALVPRCTPSAGPERVVRPRLGISSKTEGQRGRIRLRSNSLCYLRIGRSLRRHKMQRPLKAKVHRPSPCSGVLRSSHCSPAYSFP